MQTDVAGPRMTGKMLWGRGVIHEITLSWRFIAGDLSSTIVPALLFLGAAWNRQTVSNGELVRAVAYGLVYFWLYVYVFCLSNQLAGIEEDRVNKPYRPLVTGAVSYRGVQERWLLMMVFFAILGWLLDVLHWTLLWQIVVVLHNFGGWAKRWYGKNVLMSFGLIAQLGAAWELVQPMTGVAWQWVLVIAGVVFLLVPVQDLRDMDGDRRVDRRTFPLVFGEKLTRIFLATCFGVLPLILHYGLMQPAGASWTIFACDISLAALSLALSARVLLCRTTRADHWTYLLFTYWYCLVLLSAMIIL